MFIVPLIYESSLTYLYLYCICFVDITFVAKCDTIMDKRTRYINPDVYCDFTCQIRVRFRIITPMGPITFLKRMSISLCLYNLSGLLCVRHILVTLVIRISYSYTYGQNLGTYFNVVKYFVEIFNVVNTILKSSILSNKFGIT